VTKLTGKFFGLFPSTMMRVRLSAQDSDLNQKLRTVLDDIRKSTPNGLPKHAASQAYITRGSGNQLHLRPELTDIVLLVCTEAEAYAEKIMLDMDAGNLVINACWLTVLEKGEAVEMHTNPSSVFTATYFVNASPKGVNFRFFSSVGENWPHTPSTTANRVNKRVESILGFPGELIIFPSNLINDVHGHDDETGHVSLTFTFDVAPIAPG